MRTPFHRCLALAAAFVAVSGALIGRAPAAQFIVPVVPSIAAAPTLVPAVAPSTAAIVPAGPGFSDGLFGQRVVATEGSGPFPRWQKVIDRFAGQRADDAAFCPAANPDTCPPAIWRKLVAALSTLPLNQRVALVNDFFNRIPYIRAEVNWGDPAYWETPYELMTHGGQCQDYAIAKFLALRESGVPENLLRFVVVHDAMVGLDHAITVVDVDGQPLALDNQMRGVTPVSDLTMRYVPYYSLNDGGWWSYIAQVNPIVTYSVEPQTVSFASTFQVARY